jgi:hypothetical protein
VKQENQALENCSLDHPSRKLRVLPMKNLSRNVRTFLLLLFVTNLVGCNQNRPTLPTAGPAKVTLVEASQLELTDRDEFVGRTEVSETVEVRSTSLRLYQSQLPSRVAIS